MGLGHFSLNLSPFISLSSMPSPDLLPALSGERYYDPEAWGPRHRLCVHLHACSWKGTEISAHMNVSQSWVSRTLGDIRATYEVQDMAAAISERVTDVAVRISLHTNEALDEIIEEMRTCSDVRVRQKAAFGILDRGGFTPATKAVEAAPPVLPEEVVDRMEAATKELVQYQGVYREAEPLPADDEPDIE